MSKRILLGLMALLPLLAFAQSRLELTAKGEKVTIVRDEFGVPHVMADTIYALFYGNGYAVAQDRLWQMERNRRVARGDAAELFGQSAVAQDQATRLEGYTEEEMEAMARRLTEEGQTILQAFADGVNAYIKEATDQNKLPKGYADAGARPRPWKVTDTVAIGTMMMRRFGSVAAGGGEMRNMGLLAYLRMRNKDTADLLLNELAWRNDPSSPVTVPPEEDPRRPAKIDPKKDLERLRAQLAAMPNIGLDVLMRTIRVLNQDDQREFALANGLFTQFGSYALVVAPSKSATGNPILMGAPQMGFGTPHIAHEMHLMGAGINAMGMGFAGVPGILIGHTEKIAWTFTSGVADQADVYLEKINPANPDEYWHKGQWLKFEKRAEQIAVKGGQPVSMEVLRSVHGPILAVDKANNVALAKKSSMWLQETDSLQAYTGFLRANNLQEFGAAAKWYVGSFNCFAASRDGDIGYWFCGRQPVRPESLDPRLPVWGTGEYEWLGMMPFEAMPRMMNPKQGFIVNWNNKPAVWWDNSDTPVWGAIFRMHRMIPLVKNKAKLTVDDVKRVAVDISTYDLNYDYLRPILLDAAKKQPGALSADAKQAMRLIEAWNGYGYEGSVPKAIFDQWINSLREKIFLDDYGNLFDQNLFRTALQPSFIYYALKGRSSAVPRIHDFLNGKKQEEVAIDALNDACTELARQHGPAMADWRYRAGRMNLAPLGAVPYDERGSYIQVIEVGKDRMYSENILPPGQSEDPSSKHYSDQRELSGWWMFKPMRFYREQFDKP